jgi:SAM-dependent methyltransferase
MTGSSSAGAHLAQLYQDIERYYSRQIEVHGATPLGVAWPCQPTQELRFVQLLRVCEAQPSFSLNDLGCGYGALLAFLAKRHRRKKINYLGLDLSPQMIAEARRLWSKRPQTEFLVASASPRVADYSLASGIFNVKLNQSEALWTDFVETTLIAMRTASRRGFAVNFLAPLAQGESPHAELYRTPPGVWQAYCEKNFHAQVELLQGYGMREFTLLVHLPQTPVNAP